MQCISSHLGWQLDQTGVACQCRHRRRQAVWAGLAAQLGGRPKKQHNPAGGRALEPRCPIARLLPPPLLLLHLLSRGAILLGCCCLRLSLCRPMLLLTTSLSLSLLAAVTTCRTAKRGVQQLSAPFIQRLARSCQGPGQLGQACCAVFLWTPAVRRPLHGEQQRLGGAAPQDVAPAARGAAQGSKLKAAAQSCMQHGGMKARIQ